MGLTFIPTDFTGRAPGNLRVDEVHHLITVPNRENRAFVCKHGAFYSASMRVRDASGRLLDAGVDYSTVYHYADMSKLTGKEVMGFVIVKNSEVQSPIKVTYQALGGPFSISADELKELLDSVDVSNFPFTWGDIIGKPIVFKPEDHPHEYWQLYGLDTTVTEINRIADAWKVGNSSVIEENEGYADSYLESARDEINRYQQAVTAHLRNFNNPHRLTTLQVQREKLNNWGFSGVFHIADPTNANTYLPIGGVYQILNTTLLPQLRSHLTNFNNPHQNTAEQVGSFTKGYVDNELVKKLLWTKPAYNSTLYGGYPANTYYNMARTNIPATNIVSGKFLHAQLGTGYDGTAASNWVLTGAKKWAHWSTFLQPINAKRGKIAFVGTVGNATTVPAILTTSFSDPIRWPPGSLAMAQLHIAPNSIHQYNIVIYERRPAGNWVVKAS